MGDKEIADKTNKNTDSMPVAVADRGGLKNRIETIFFRTVEQTIANLGMFKAGDNVLAAVSGGPDSVALLHILLELAPKYAFRLGIAHLNHGLRQDNSDRDAEFVASLSGRLGLPFYGEKVDVRKYRRQHRLSLEEAARNVRYAFLNEVANRNGFSKIAFGHHSDDNAELVLMYLFRGSGSQGLSGIPPMRDGKIVRPLMDLKRCEIMDYLNAKKWQYVSDASNADLTFVRNKIRHQLIPELKATYNPKIVDALNRLASIIRSEEEWIDQLVGPIFKGVVSDASQDGIRLFLAPLQQLPLAAKRRVVRKAVLSVHGDLRRITMSHVDAVIHLAGSGPGSGELDLPNQIKVSKCGAEIAFVRHGQNLRKKSIEPIPVFQYELIQPGKVVIKETGCVITTVEIGIHDLPEFEQADTNIAFFDKEKLKFPLCIRNLRPGDRFSPLGLHGTQKLNKFFIDHKVPNSARATCPILLSQDKIIWLAGYRLGNFAKIRPKTKRVIKAVLSLA